MQELLTHLGIAKQNGGTFIGTQKLLLGDVNLPSISPINGEIIASTQQTTKEEYESTVQAAQKSFKYWRNIPAPKRGEIVRKMGNQFREYKTPLATLICSEMGKSYQEALGEVQEIIDICDFAVGLSRQLYGLSMHSERPSHRLCEQWHPLGIVGIISAFNFPAAVWGWNAMLAFVCGDVCIWKPSEKTPLTAIACHHIAARVLRENNMPDGIACLVNGDKEVGAWIAKDLQIPLVSATGSTTMGKQVAVAVGERLGKSLLELGGNNAIIITPNADLENCLMPIVFGAVGTAGQRCTTTRRLIIHSSIYESVKEKLHAAYPNINVGNPLDESNHLGPLIDKESVKKYSEAIALCKAQGGTFLIDGGILEGIDYQSGCYVKPCIAEVASGLPITQQETFAPILYLMKYETLEEAIAIQNNVPQGLSSAIMSTNVYEIEYFLSAQGSDCGIANVNIGTSGAEIGGAFGGEKETGGGRESGSDAWKNYMRRQTVTINGDKENSALSQGIKFDI